MLNAHALHQAEAVASAEALGGHFTADFQTALLALFVRDQRLSDSLLQFIHPQQFSDVFGGEYLREAVGWVKYYHEKYGSLLPQTVFDQWGWQWAQAKNSNQDHHQASMQWLSHKLYQEVLPDPEFLESEFFSWYANVEQKLLILEMKQHFDKGGDLNDLDVLEKLKQLGQAEVNAKEPAMTLGSGDLAELTRFKSAPARSTLPCGIEPLDEAAKGGMGRKELWVPAAPPNGGKTTVCCNLSARFVCRGNFVVYFSLEQAKEQIYEKHLCSMSGVAPEVMRETEGMAESWAVYLHQTGGLLAVQEFPQGTATVKDFKAVVRQLEYQYGRKVDVVLVDYADDMKLGTQYNDLRHKLKEVYVQLRSWAFSDNFLCITPTQVNRDASTKEVFGIEALSEAYMKAAVADGIISLCATEDELNMGIMRFFLAKNRHGPKYVSITLAIDLALIQLEVRESGVIRAGQMPGSAAGTFVAHGAPQDAPGIQPAVYTGIPVPSMVTPPTPAPGVIQ